MNLSKQNLSFDLFMEKLEEFGEPLHESFIASLYKDIWRQKHAELFRKHPYYDGKIGISLRNVKPAFLHDYPRKYVRAIKPVQIIKDPYGPLAVSAKITSDLLRLRRRETYQDEDDKVNLNDPEKSNQDVDKLIADSDLTNKNLKQESIADDSKIGSDERTKISFIEQRKSLPIYQFKDQLIQKVADSQILIVVGETGSGKTTQITQYLAESGYTERGMIGCTQPRRVAAVSVAKRVAEEFGCGVGDEVGYTIRFEDITSSKTVIKYMTDGTLLRECLLDFDLKNYSVIMLDEAHERTIHTDVLLGLLKTATSRRPDLKLIVTSATLDSEKFSQYFSSAPIFTIPGRTFPVDILYAEEPQRDYLDASILTVINIHLNEPPGDILLFLTGKEEIETACDLLSDEMKSHGPDIPNLIILPIYSTLPFELQNRIFEPIPKGSRKVVVATNIAETSLTIDEIYYVVDSGFVKQKVYNPNKGMNSLIVTPISQAQAKQRTGRAGRTGPGVCYRVYTQWSYNNEMFPMSVPEIQRTNMLETVLQLKSMGIDDLYYFDFMDKPSDDTLNDALEMLYFLDALDDEGNFTETGRQMAEFPIDPRLSKILLESVALECSEEALTVVSMLSVQDIFYRPKNKQALFDWKKANFDHIEGDHITLLAIYDKWCSNNCSADWCYENFINYRTLKQVQNIRKQLLGIMERQKLKLISCKGHIPLLQMALCTGYFRNVAQLYTNKHYTRLVDDTSAYIHPSSALRAESYYPEASWIIYHETVYTNKEYMRMTTAVDPIWLLEFAPKYFRFYVKPYRKRNKQEISNYSDEF
ncbi:ATP-dependent RNA helicase dhx8 [Blomia tropicalis]|nr:ATP-dependent RNA helicase dhx8 [Blomia tropicalis]